MANGRCRYHGGASLKGVDSPSYKTGRYSKYAPTQLIPLIDEAFRDPAMLSQRQEIALVTSRAESLMQQMESCPTGRTWNELRKLFQDWRTGEIEAKQCATAGDDMGEKRARERSTAACVALGRILDAGQSEFESWEQIGSLVEQRRKLVESERKRLVESQQVIALTQVQTILDALIRTIREHVVDGPTVLRIESGFSSILGGTGFQPAN